MWWLGIETTMVTWESPMTKSLSKLSKYQVQSCLPLSWMLSAVSIGFNEEHTINRIGTMTLTNHVDWDEPNDEISFKHRYDQGHNFCSHLKYVTQVLSSAMKAPCITTSVAKSGEEFLSVLNQQQIPSKSIQVHRGIQLWPFISYKYL